MKPSLAWIASINALAAAYRVELSEPQLDAYWLATEGIPLERVQRAVKRSVRSGGHFMPTAAELRELAGVPRVPYHAPWKPPQWQLEQRPEWPAMIEAKKPEGA